MFDQSDTPSKIRCETLGLGWRSGMQLTAEVSPIANAFDMRRDVNFNLSNWAYSEARLYRFALSSGSGESRFPALFSQFGDEDIDLCLFIRPSVVLPRGQTSILLPRPALEGSVSIKGKDWETDHGFTVNGRTVSIPEPVTENLRVFFRPLFVVRCIEPWKMSETEHTALVDWQIAFEEQPFE